MYADADNGKQTWHVVRARALGSVALVYRLPAGSEVQLFDRPTAEAR